MTASSARTYPLEIEGQLSQTLDRGLWLVKWLLVIPHVIALAFLGLAFVVLSVVAFFAILITGRYPRAIFDFNVGVLRWSWRVGFSSYSTLGTDRYPPFSLGEVPDYPTRLDVEYPAVLSRGRVLVKWWLLALPQYARRRRTADCELKVRAGARNADEGPGIFVVILRLPEVVQAETVAIYVTISASRFACRTTRSIISRSLRCARCDPASRGPPASTCREPAEAY